MTEYINTPPKFDEEASRIRGLAALAELGEKHATYLACTLCGQHVIKLDAHGLCSKVTDAHKAARRP
jgi:hypothetical protein